MITADKARAMVFRDRDINVYGYEAIPEDQWVEFEGRDDVLSGEEPGWDDFLIEAL